MYFACIQGKTALHPNLAFVGISLISIVDYLMLTAIFFLFAWLDSPILTAEYSIPFTYFGH
jgi:hypothetical protein